MEHVSPVLEQGTTGQSGPAERVTHTNSMLGSSVPMLQLGTATPAAKHYSVCVCVCLLCVC